MDCDELAACIDTSFRQAVYDKTKLAVNQMLFDGDRPKLSHEAILRWAARRSWQEIDIADLCGVLAQNPKLDKALRLHLSNQEQQEREHNRLLVRLIEDIGDSKTIEYLHNQSKDDLHISWNRFMMSLKNEDPLVAMIRLEYGHEVLSDAGFEEIFKLPYARVVNTLRLIAEEERTHGQLGRVALRRYLETIDGLKAEVIDEYKNSQFISFWLWTFWN